MINRTISIIFLFFTSIIISQAQHERFVKKTLVDSLNSPWEILYGPNDSLWVTESFNYTVKRIDVKTGLSTILLDISKEKNFDNKHGKWPQGGLMGLALHPSLYSGDLKDRKSWVYLAYIFHRIVDQPCAADGNFRGPCSFKTRIVRYEYKDDKLINPIIIADSLPGSNDHNSGRLVINPALDKENEGKRNAYHLYYSIGDMGAGQFNNKERTNNAQNVDVAEGKILRFNTEPDQDKGLDAWVPNDNPFYQSDSITQKDYIFSYGHRNAQGLVWGLVGGTWKLYSSEHGHKSDDEINIIVKGGNYGWNRIAGYRDNNYKGMTLRGYTPVDEINFPQKTIDPICSLFPVENKVLKSLSENSFSWPSIAPSSIDIYTSGSIPGWKNSLLVTTLKAGKVYRFKLDPSGNAIANMNGKIDSVAYFSGEGRFRDLAISPDGFRIFVACDNGGPALGKNKTYNWNGTPPANAGSILEFTYQNEVSKVPKKE